MSAKRDLINRYRVAWRQSWRARKTMDRPNRLRHETEFLPASLALQEQPVHPAPRYIQWSIMAFAALTLLWAFLGEIDVVATASGKIVPSGRSKIIQPSDVGVVKAIHVQDGQQVKAGDLLIELDANITNADVERLEGELLSSQIDIARARAMLTAIENESVVPDVAAFLPQATSIQQAAAQGWVEGQYFELRSTVNQSSAEIEQRIAEIQSVQTTIKALQQTLPITRELASDYKRMFDSQFIAKHAYLEKEQIRLAQEKELAFQQARVHELNAAKKAADSRKSSILAQTRRTMLDLQHEAEIRRSGITQELLKAKQLDRQMQLKAPVAGTVQQLAVHTEGGVVTEAQPLMVIVPSDQPVEVEAMLENKDIGFVRAGQVVEIKVETFSFTKYGVVEGTVISISNDAIQDERLGLVYSVRIQLHDEKILVGNNYVALSPGMAIRAEVKIDRRRVIDYFLSPLKQHADESLSER